VGFHNDRLYEHLRPVLPSLIELLKDGEEKIRANAAGALVFNIKKEIL
jgi:fused-like protein